ASLMYMDRGRHFEESRDWSSAYHAYVEAYSFDPSNEEARSRMKMMLDKQGIPNIDGTPTTVDQANKKQDQQDIVTDFQGYPIRRISGKPKTPLPESDISFQKGTQIRQVIDIWDALFVQHHLHSGSC